MFRPPGRLVVIPAHQQPGHKVEPHRAEEDDLAPDEGRVFSPEGLEPPRRAEAVDPMRLSAG